MSADRFWPDVAQLSNGKILLAYHWNRNASRLQWESRRNQPGQRGRDNRGDVTFKMPTLNWLLRKDFGRGAFRAFHECMCNRIGPTSAYYYKHHSLYYYNY